MCMCLTNNFAKQKRFIACMTNSKPRIKHIKLVFLCISCILAISEYRKYLMICTIATYDWLYINCIQRGIASYTRNVSAWNIYLAQVWWANILLFKP